MSDVQPTSDVAGVIDGGTPPPAAPTQDYQALWEQEKQERIRERNLYKPAMNLLRDLDDDAVAAITSLTDMARRGDTAGIVDWSLATAQNVSGSDLAALIAARQNGTQQQPMVPQSAPVQQPGGIQSAETQRALDIETARQIAREEAQEQFRLQQAVQVVTQELTAAGFPPDSPAGQSIIHWARTNGKTPAEGIAWYTADLDARAAARTAALAATAAATPDTAPNGAPAGSSPAKDMTPQQRAFARLTSGQNG